MVLGCTHFVFYRDYFRELLPERAAVIDGNEGTVRHLGVVLESLVLAPEDATGGVEAAEFDSVRTDCRVVTQIAERMSLFLAPLSEGSQEEPEEFSTLRHIVVRAARVSHNQIQVNRGLV